MSNSDKIILDLCGGTGCWSEPYRQSGYDVRLITLPYYDVRTYTPPEHVYGVLAAPPCTHFSIACAQYWKQKDLDGRTADGLSIVYACLDIVKKTNPVFWALENPKGRLTRWLGRPYAIYHWADFDAPYDKITFLWGHFNTLLVTTERTKKLRRLQDLHADELYQLPLGYNLNIDHSKRAAQRSIYPPDFCYSFFLANQ